MFSKELLEQTLDVQPVLDLLDPLLPDGLHDIPDSVVRPMERDDYSDALAMANAYYAKQGIQHANAVIIYVTLLVVRGLTTEARAILRKAAEHHQSNVAFQLLTVVALVADDCNAEAEALLDGLTHVPMPERLMGLVGDLLLDMGREDQAMECYKKMCTQLLNSPDVPYKLGHILFEREEFYDAAAYFEQAARLAVDTESLWLLTAQTWIQADNNPSAIEALGRVLKFQDDDEDLWTQYGMLLATEGQMSKARHALERACRLDELSPDRFIQLAFVEMDLGFFDEASQHFNSAIALDPDSVEALYGASFIAMEVGDVLLAEKLARRALAIDDTDIECQFHLGIILSERNKHDEAITHFDHAINDAAEVPGVYHIVYAASLVALGRVDDAMERVNLAWSEETPGLEVQGASVGFVEQLIKRGHLDGALTFLGATSAAGEDTWQCINRAMTILTSYL
jgi:tetratricopeptide (TPR) repeat protein